MPLNLLPLIANQLTVTGSIMGTIDDMKNLMNLIARAGIEPEIGAVLPMEHSEEAFRAMWQGKTRGKTVFTRNAIGPVLLLCRLATPFEQSCHLDMAHQRSPSAKQGHQFCFNHLGRTQLATCVQDERFLGGQRAAASVSRASSN